jgi:hypothetical protein
MYCLFGKLRKGFYFLGDCLPLDFVVRLVGTGVVDFFLGFGVAGFFDFSRAGIAGIFGDEMSDLEVVLDLRFSVLADFGFFDVAEVVFLAEVVPGFRVDCFLVLMD